MTIANLDIAKLKKTIAESSDQSTCLDQIKLDLKGLVDSGHGQQPTDLLESAQMLLMLVDIAQLCSDPDRSAELLSYISENIDVLGSDKELEANEFVNQTRIRWKEYLDCSPGFEPEDPWDCEQESSNPTSIAVSYTHLTLPTKA